MSELKVYHCNEWHNEYTEFYMKSEADKVIAELKAQVNAHNNRANLWHYNALDEHNATVALRMENAKLKAKLEDVQKSAYAELEEERRWRKFPDEKPRWGEEVIVVDDASKQYIVRFSYDMKWISWGNMNTCESKYVKYWMPLPKAPEADKYSRR